MTGSPGAPPGAAARGIPVTALVATRNEAANVARCLASARDLVDQIFVIDSESDDGTAAIAARFADEVCSLPYGHGTLIPAIFQWGLDHLPIRHEWVLLLEADQAVTPELAAELRALFARPHIAEDGFFIRRRQVFRGRPIRFGGYGRKRLLKLFRRARARLDPREQDTRVYVDGATGRLRHPIVEDNAKEAEILFYLAKHLRYADAFAREELARRGGLPWLARPRLFGNSDERTLWLKTRYYRLPLYARPVLYFAYRYFLRLGILDGKQGAIFHFLQAFWFRLVVDIRLEELMAARADAPRADGAGTEPRGGAPPGRGAG